MKTIVYGCSDDLIEVEGDCITDEFSAFAPDEKDGKRIAFSDGMVFHVYYDSDGIWRFKPVVPIRSGWTIEWAAGEDSYSDRWTCTRPLEWVLLGDRFARTEVEQEAKP